ncbi:MAG: hypothetical protein COT00_04490, partial [Candidatus Omnitrophica bacterium CG07_land_8_20_14_0_80_50_8]
MPLVTLTACFIGTSAFAAKAAVAPSALPETSGGSTTLWQLVSGGGINMIFLGILSVMALASIIYHFLNVSVQKLTPVEFTENLLFLLEKKEYQKAVS